MKNEDSEPFAMTLAGFIVPMITGLISATSSALILYVILKSDIKLYSTYHRIMALMSCFDIVSSISIALGTIMMPSDNLYPFAGPMLGNKLTCQMQGWLVVFGITGATSFNACLSLYFVLSIVYKVESNKMEKYIEPSIFTLASIFAFSAPSIFLSKDFLNPHPYDSFCTVSPYPDSCQGNQLYSLSSCTWVEGLMDSFHRYEWISKGLLLCLFTLIAFGMIIILCSMIRIRRQEKESTSTSTSREKDIENDCKNFVSDNHIGLTVQANDPIINNMPLNHIRIIMIQALLYVGALILTWLFNFLSSLIDVSSYYLDGCSSVFFPLQGFWNLCIFMFDKVCMVRNAAQSEKITLWEAVIRIVLSPSAVPNVILSDISIISEDIRQVSQKILY